jgi:transcriptional regulator with XRE-family HTH domain
MSLLERLGKRLKMVRVTAGVKQKDLAKKLDVPAPLLSMYENGVREPSLNFLDMFAKEFKISLSQLFSLLEENNPKISSNMSGIVEEMKSLIFDLEKQALKVR